MALSGQGRGKGEWPFETYMKPTISLSVSYVSSPTPTSLITFATLLHAAALYSYPHYSSALSRIFEAQDLTTFMEKRSTCVNATTAMGIEGINYSWKRNDVKAHTPKTLKNKLSLLWGKSYQKCHTSWITVFSRNPIFFVIWTKRNRQLFLLIHLRARLRHLQNKRHRMIK